MRSLLLVACAAPAAPVANHAAPDPRPSIESCRAAVTKHYDSGVERHGNVIVTTSDVCGLVIQPIFFTRDATSFPVAQADELAGMLACLDQTEHLRMRIQLTGHAGRDERDPLALAQARAEAVQRYFEACGVPALGWSAVGDAPGSGERDRRVDPLIVERTP